MRTRKRILKKTFRTSKKKKQLKKTSTSKSLKKGGMNDSVTGRKVFSNPIVSVPASFLDNRDKSSLRDVSKTAKIELGKECEGIDTDYIGIKPPYKDPKMEVFWKTIPNPNVKKGSNQGCWKRMSLDELRNLELFQNYTTMFQDVIVNENEAIFFSDQNTYHEEPLAVLAIALLNGQFYDFVDFLQSHIDKVLADTELLKYIFHYLEEDGKDINLRHPDGYTVLDFVAEMGYLEVVEALFNSDKLDVNNADDNGFTPLIIAASEGHLEIVITLLSNDKVEVNIAELENGSTSLHAAIINERLEIVRTLLSNDKIEVNMDNKLGHTPLYVAAHLGRLEIVRTLLSNDKIEVNKADLENGYTPLHIATLNEHLKVVEALLSNVNVDVDNISENNWTPLLIAATHGNLEIVRTLLSNDKVDVNKIGIDGFTPLIIAIFNEHLEVVEALLSNVNIDVNQITKEGSTPLDLAQKKGYTEIENLIRNHIKETSKSLKKGGMNDSVTGRKVFSNPIVSVPASFLDNRDKSSLRDVSKTAKIELGKECEGIDTDYIGIKPPYKDSKMEVFWKAIPIPNPNFKKGSNQKCWKRMSLDEFRSQPETIVNESERRVALEFQNYTTMFQDVVGNENEAIFFRDQNTYYKEPLAVLVIALLKGEYYDFVDFLHNHMKHVLKDTELLKYVFHYLEEDGKDINLHKESPNGALWTVLDFATNKGYLKVVEALLNSDKLDVNKADAEGFTPLLIAAEEGLLEILKAILSNDKVEVNKTNKDKDTPLHIAVRYGRLKVVEELLSNDKVKVNEVNIDGYTPLYKAVIDYNGDLKIVKSLLSNDKIDVNKANFYGYTPLHRAIRSRDLEFVKALLNKNADVNKADNNGDTPLDFAQRKGYTEIENLIKAHQQKE